MFQTRAFAAIAAAACALLGADAGAQVVRCVDAAGNVRYTDSGCAKGDRRSEVVLGPEATQPPAAPGLDRRQEQLDSVERVRRLQRESVETVQRPATPPGGLVVIDPQADRDQAERRQREAQLAADEARRQSYGDGYGYGYPRPAPPPPRDMRPRLRNCDASGCRDNMGNHYDPKGNVDRFVQPDGRTCRPVNTTVVCQ
jgi:hypothetical protein